MIGLGYMEGTSRVQFLLKGATRVHDPGFFELGLGKKVGIFFLHKKYKVLGVATNNQPIL